MNAAIFYNNPDPRSYVSLVPTSAHTGDGMGDLIAQVVRLTQTRLSQRLSFSEELQSMVLEVRRVFIRLFTFSTEFRKRERERKSQKEMSEYEENFFANLRPVVRIQLMVDTHQAKQCRKDGFINKRDMRDFTYIALSSLHVASERMLCIPVKRAFDSFMCFISYGTY